MHPRSEIRSAGGATARRAARATTLACLLLGSPAAGQEAAGEREPPDPVPVPALSAGEAERALERQAAWTALLARYDLDGDGTLARDEYTRGITGFVLLDRDRDGRVTADDFGPSYPRRLPELPGVPGLPDGTALATGQRAPDFELVRAGPPGGTLSLGQLLDGRGLVLVFGSLTDPALRGAAADLRELARVYARELNFVLVYVREAHALDSLAPGTFPPRAPDADGGRLTAGIEDPLTLAEREASCLRARQALELPFEAAVDRLDDLTARAYDAWPARLCLVGPDGRLVHAGARGEVDVPDLEVALLKGLTRAGRRAPEGAGSSAADAQGGSAEPAGGRPSAGVLAALDSDGDGALSPEEIDDAPRSLRALDLDGDGVLLPAEVQRVLVPDEAVTESGAEPGAEPGSDVRVGSDGGQPTDDGEDPGAERAARAGAPAPGSEAASGARAPATRRGVLQYDSDGDGRLSRIEVPRPWLEHWEGFDRDDDGYLDTAEQAALTTSLEQRSGRTEERGQEQRGSNGR